MCPLERRDLNCLKNTEEMKEAIKRDYLDLSNLKMGVSSVNSKTASQLLHCEKIKIGWLIPG